MPRWDVWAPMDITKPEQITQVIQRFRPDIVFHLAGLTRGAEVDIYHVNQRGTDYLLEALRMHAPEARILLVGSAAEYGPQPEEKMPITEACPCRPAGPYGVGKHAATVAGQDYVRRYGMRVVIARPFNIVGAGIPPTLVVGAVLERARLAL